MMVNIINAYEKNYVIQNTNSIKNQKNEYTQPDSEDSKTNEMMDSAVSLEISKRGLSMVGELQEFEDTYETRRVLTSGIGSHELINGSYMDILAKNYQEELRKLKEQYSGTIYEKQLTHLNKAYDEAADMVSRNYVKQLRILTGDIELKPKTVTSYSKEEDTILSEEDNKTKSKQYVIEPEQTEKISFDIKNMLLHMKNGQNQTQTLLSGFLTYNDIKSIGMMLLNNNTYSDTVRLSKYAQTIIEKYNSVQ